MYIVDMKLKEEKAKNYVKNSMTYASLKSLQMGSLDGKH